MLLVKKVPLNNQRNNGGTAVSFGSLKGHLLVVSILLDNGANPNLARNNGETLLMAASHNGHNDIIQLLLERNVPLNT